MEYLIVFHGSLSYPRVVLVDFDGLEELKGSLFFRKISEHPFLSYVISLPLEVKAEVEDKTIVLPVNVENYSSLNLLAEIDAYPPIFRLRLINRK
jgi:hypothetical protein